MLCWWAFPFPTETLAHLSSSTELLDRTGRPMRIRLAAQDQDCRPHYQADLKHWICKALIAAEDKRFLRHHGIDLASLVRAVGQNISSAEIVSGASTISTQVIRMADPSPHRNTAAKVKEAFRALQMERLYDKNEIIGSYLNRAPFGANIQGIEAAAQRYFGKHADTLTLGEAALLAGLPQSPTRFRPDVHFDAAKKRQRYVLGRMRMDGMISDDAYVRALDETLDIRPAVYPFDAPHFCELLFRRPTVNGVVRTTLDQRIQQCASAVLRAHSEKLAGFGIYGGAVVVIEVESGAVRALVGSPDYFNAAQSGQVNCAYEPRSPGSALKPFIYALALDSGRIIPEQKLADVPMTFGRYTPLNFDGNFNGLVTVRNALIDSLNIPAVALTDQIGTPALYEMLRRLGLSTLVQTPEHYGLGLALGNAEVRLLELTNAYACLARQGIWKPWTLTESDADIAGEPVFSPAACWIVSDMLSGDERAMQVSGHAASARLPRMAWKTGTSSGFRDAWTIGYTPEYVVGVWMGNPNGTASVHLTGIETAAPVVWEIMRALYPSQEAPWFVRPSNVVQRRICERSGLLAGPHCKACTDGTFIQNRTRLTECTVHRDASGQEIWPASVAAFLRRKSGGPLCNTDELKITEPVDQCCYRLMKDPRDAQKIKLSAVSGSSDPLFWFVDQTCLGAAQPNASLFWELQPGRHRITCSTGSGYSASVNVSVEN
jgi:penicillin-binding protein 1C